MLSDTRFSLWLCGVGLSVLIVGAATGACSSSPPPGPAVVDTGLGLARLLCLREAPKRGFDPALCELPETLRPFVEDALKTRLATLSNSETVAPLPCTPIQDAPASPVHPVPGNAVRNVGGGGS